MKILLSFALFSFIFLISFQAYPTVSFQYTLETTVVISDSSMSTENPVYIDGEGTSSSPYVLYIPYSTEAFSSGDYKSDLIENYSYFGSRDSTTTTTQALPIVTISSDTSTASFDSNPYIEFAVTHDESTNQVFQIAVKNDDGNYEVIAVEDDASASTPSFTSEASNSTSSSTSFLASFEHVCIGSCEFDNAHEEVSVDAIIMSFDDGSSKAVGDESGNQYEIPDNAMYIKLSFSSEILGCDYSSTTCVDTATFPDVSSAKRGDTSVSLTIESRSLSTMGSSDIYKTLLIQPTTTGIEYYNIRDLLHNAAVIDEYDPVTEGTFKINNLVNGNEYLFSIAQMNKYKFVSISSALFPVTPELIDPFVSEQSCYLLSAGFKTDNPMLSFFRSYRDHFLLKSNLGRGLVELYYSTAPRYAMKIRKSAFLRKVARIATHYLSYYLTGRWHLSNIKK